MTPMRSDDLDSESISSVDGTNEIDGINRSNNDDFEKETERKTLAKSENRAVFWLRILVVLVLSTTTALVVTFVYKDMINSQQTSFEAAFESDSLKVLDSFHRSVRRMMESSDSISTFYTSFALSSGSTFPNVTLPDYQLIAANSRIMSETFLFNYYPLVTDENRNGWEAFVLENQNLYNSSAASELGWIAYQNSLFNKSQERNLQVFDGFHNKIGNVETDGSVSLAKKGTGPYLPLWQASPFIPDVVLLNSNALAHSSTQTFSKTLTTSQAVVSPAENLYNENAGPEGDYFQMVLSMSQFRDMGEQLNDPASPFSYPVFDSFDPTTRKVAGIVSSTFYWTFYFENILPINRKGIYCVIENSFNQTFTYRIDGSEALYMGVGDLHDTKYDYLKVTSDMASYLESHSSLKTTSYTIVPLNAEFNSYSLTIYPSQDTEDEYVNNEPVVLAITIVSVFLFTCLVFLVYDWYVARRQRIVMDRAVASGAIVSSLFPLQVRDNIYKESDKKTKAAFLSKAVDQNNYDEINDGDIVSSKPNAVLFPETTIMFADMAGFTAWSSTRGPVEVFELLETVYRSFDVIAARRRVFKVETIGDCYVAVAGLPNPQQDHALIMVKFAEDCILKIDEVTAKLAPTLGEDTTHLKIRVGLHSGPVTGGVLRGEKARFQLFGDTMNTASRMETNGLIGRIHVSDATAKALLDKGKAHWLEPRSDKVLVKGKGEMQTFWVSTRTNGSSGPRSSAGSLNVSEDEFVMNDSPPNMLGTEGTNEGLTGFDTFEI
jgi:class 3 adenylate cyclase